MARRMFSPEIVGSDAFVEMPTSSQALYFHLGMRADDDGFVNPQITMRMIGVMSDDLKILIAKRFVLPFESGVVVVKHWRINNFVRKDRYKETNYLEEKNKLHVKENQAYTLDTGQGKHIGLVPWKSEEQMRSTSGQPLVNAGEDRIGKDRIGKREDTQTKFGSVSFLKEPPTDVVNELSIKYQIAPKGITQKAYDLFLWCEMNGKRKKNNKMFLENALRRDKVKLQNDYPFQKQVVALPEAPLTPEQLERNRAIKASIGQMLRK